MFLLIIEFILFSERMGSGKTTLLRSVLGFESLYSGNVYYKQKDILSISLKERSQLISWSPAATHLAFSYTAFDIILFGRYPWHTGSPSQEDRRKVQQIARDLDLFDKLERTYCQLSSGEQRLVLLARALIGEHQLILLDEPSNNLDTDIAYHCLEFIRQLSRQGRLILVVTHDLLLAKEFADTSIELKNNNCYENTTALSCLTIENYRSFFGD